MLYAKHKTIMCKISIDTIIQANKRTMARSKDSFKPLSSPNAFEVSVSHNGREYRQEISFEQIKESYGRALKLVMNGKTI